MGSHSTILTCVGEWERSKLRLLPPNSMDQVKEVFELLDRPYATDLVTLYTITGGMDYEMARGCFCLWPLSRISQHASDRCKTGEISFADCLIESHTYEARKESNDTSSIWTAGELVAETLDEFFRLYVERSTELRLLW
jgi:hypothetical protein